MAINFNTTAKFATVAAFATLMSASTASAVSLTFDGFAEGSKQVNVSATTPGGVTGTYSAGAFKMKSTEESFIVFCLDVVGNIFSGVNYDYELTENPFDTSVFLTTSAGQIQKLFDSGYQDALENSVSSAGFQVALWNAVYDDDWDVFGGVFKQTADNGGVRTAAQNFLDGAKTWTGGKNWNLSFLEAKGKNDDGTDIQNLVTVTPVPLPAGGLLLLSAMGGLMLSRRRKEA